MTKMIKEYNVTNVGLYYSNEDTYSCYEFIKFNTNNKATEVKYLYFKVTPETIIPKFNSRTEIEKFMEYKNNSRLIVKKVLQIIEEK